MSKLPLFEGASFDAPEIERYLERLTEKGWGVFSNNQPKSYVVTIDDDSRIDIKFRVQRKEWTVQGRQQGKAVYLKHARSFTSFTSFLAEAANRLGADLNSGPSSIRLAEKSPVSNRAGLVALSHGAAVKGIFDPYFDDKAINNLKTFRNLGMGLTSPVRVLTTSKGTQRLSSNMISGFNVETGKALDIHQCNSTKEHRRFLLLDSGDSIVIGCSLNSLDKNEAAHVESSPEDQAFFDEQWQLSSSL